MRLIDADKLLPKLWVCYEENKPIVDSEPTVEAIPVEWVKKYLAKLIVVQDDLYCPNQLLIGRVIGIEIMLEEWEKENEID